MDEGQEGNAALLGMRFDATIYPGRKTETNWADALDVDRVPSHEGEIRALLSVEDLVRLLEQGLEVRLSRVHASGPLDPALIEPDESFQRWLDEKVNRLKATPAPKPFIEP